jgi:DNA polymerase-2
MNSTKFSVSKDLHNICYQDDISVETKYLLDNKLEFSRKRHIAYFDIETYYDENNTEGNSVENAELPITSIVFYSNILECYFILDWHPTIDTGEEPFTFEEKGNKRYYMCKDESVVLNTFCCMVKEFNIDIITGWYSHGYDVPYILKRLEILFGHKNDLSPVGNCWLGDKMPQDIYYKIKINGLDSIDMMEVVQSLNYNLQNNKLDTAAGEILGEKYKKLKTSTWRDWEDNFEGFLKYAIRDVEILYLIDKKLKCFEYLIQMQILSGISTLNDI